MNILFTICARAGSKGLKNKNIKKLNGIPLSYYTIAVIKLYKEAHPEHKVEVAVNTDSSELIEVIKEQKMINEIHFVKRKPELAGDRSAKVDVIRDTYFECDKESNFYDLIVDLDLTSPLRRLEDIENAIREMQNNNYDLVFSVVKSRRSPYFNMVEQKGDGYYRKICESKFTARQQAPKTYELNASIYVYRNSFLNSDITKTILDYDCGIVEMKDYLVLDIDSEEDFIMLEKLIPFYAEELAEINKVINT